MAISGLAISVHTNVKHKKIRSLVGIELLRHHAIGAQLTIKKILRYGIATVWSNVNSYTHNYVCVYFYE